MGNIEQNLGKFDLMPLISVFEMVFVTTRVDRHWQEGKSVNSYLFDWRTVYSISLFWCGSCKILYSNKVNNKKKKKKPGTLTWMMWA